MKVDKKCSLGYGCGPVMTAIYKHSKAIGRDVGRFVRFYKRETKQLDDSSPKLRENLWKWKISTDDCFQGDNQLIS